MPNRKVFKTHFRNGSRTKNRSEGEYMIRIPRQDPVMLKKTFRNLILAHNFKYQHPNFMTGVKKLDSFSSVPDPWHIGTDQVPNLWLTDQDPALFVNDLFKFFWLLHFEGTLTHHSSKIKIYKEVTKQQKSRVVLLFLLDHRRIRIRILIRTSDFRIRFSFFVNFLVWDFFLLKKCCAWHDAKINWSYQEKLNVRRSK